MGQIYVPVDANAVDGINTLDTSGGGQTQGGYWITWTSEGYTAIGWFWDDPNNYLKTGWANAVEKYGGVIGENCTGNGDGNPHTAEQSSFLIHVENGHSEDLNDILADWPNGSKLQFIKTHNNVFLL